MRAIISAARPLTAIAAATAALAAMVMFASNIYAADAPALTNNQALAYRNLVQTGDLFILIRYELPISATTSVSDEWCAQLVNDQGCELDPPIPEEPESLISGAAFVTVYTGTTTLAQQIQAPRIDHALGGAYFDPGHGITWASADTLACIESSATLFDTQTQDCLTPSWNTAATDQASQRAQLEADLPLVLLETQGARSLALGTYVNNVGLITSAGRTLAVEALGIVDRIVPDAFQTAAESAITAGYTPVAGDSALQISIDATAAASGITDALDGVGQEFFGQSGAAIATFLVILLGLLVGGAMYRATSSGVLALGAFFTPMMVGLWVRAPTISVLFALLAVMVTMGGWYWVRKAAGN